MLLSDRYSTGSLVGISVVLLAWWLVERSWFDQITPEERHSLNALRGALASLLGVTVTVASGDNGSADGVSDGAAHVDFPSSSPFALACGGTRLEGTGSKIEAESVLGAYSRAPAFACRCRYTIYGSGAVVVETKVTPRSELPNRPRIGLMLCLPEGLDQLMVKAVAAATRRSRELAG